MPNDISGPVLDGGNPETSDATQLPGAMDTMISLKQKDGKVHLTF